MNDTKLGTRSRCLLTWLLATAGAAALVAWAAPDVALPPRMASFDAWLTRLCALVTVLCAAWGWLATSAVVLEALGRRPRRYAVPGVPRWVRRVVLAACGAAVLGSTTPAVAVPGQPEPERRERSSLLAGLPLPDRAEGRSVSEVVAQVIASHPGPPEPTAEGHVVRPGDSLWSIAEHALRESGGAATATEVAAYWPRIYAVNSDVVGTDPDLLQPGQVLRLPPTTTPTPTAGEDLR